MSPPLDASRLDRRRFTPGQLDTLFQAILIDDDIDAHTELPARITLDHDDARLVDGFRISRQLWLEGVDHVALVALVRKLQRQRDLGPEDRIALKHDRAKLKHFRFACALFSATHRYPRVVNKLTTALGRLQDAFQNGQRKRVYRQSLVCRLLLSKAARALLRREQDRLVPATTASFRQFVGSQIGAIEDILGRPQVTGEMFHATRKIVSRQVAFYNALLAIAPCEEFLKMSRSLAAINGLMGAMHDELVRRRIAGTQDYHREEFPLPDEIRARLAALVARYRASGLRRE